MFKSRMGLVELLHVSTLKTPPLNNAGSYAAAVVHSENWCIGLCENNFVFFTHEKITVAMVT